MKDRVNSEESLRILVATHSPLSLEFGAGQVAINLAEAFRIQGHNVTLWSSCPLPQLNFNILPSLQNISNARKKLDVFLDSEDTFDLIDCPSIYISKKVLRSGSVIVSRSVQPDILYLICDLMQIRGWSNLLRKPLHFLDMCCYLCYLVQGWHRATSILCLGTLELQWMKDKFPWLSNKLSWYVNTLAREEQEILSKIRSQRKPLKSHPTKFLWIGRWASHKGTTTLIDFIIERANLRPDESFTIAGCGDNAEQDIPIQLIKSGKVKIIPKFTREDLFSLLAEHEVGLFSSKVEGWGLVLNEMLESGMSLYATHCGGTQDLARYFPDTLGSFPPPLDISSPNYKNCDWQEYYEHFTWKGIAEYYLKIHDLA